MNNVINIVAYLNYEEIVTRTERFACIVKDLTQPKLFLGEYQKQLRVYTSLTKGNANDKA